MRPALQPPPPPPDDPTLLAGLRAGDEAAFLALVERHHGSMVRLARSWVGGQAAAEDVVQDAWVGVLNGVGRFEGRSSLKTWLFRIVVHCAQTRRAREGRSVPFSALEAGDDGPGVDPDRFQDAASRYAGNWSSPPQPWAERALLAGETLRLVEAELDRLPAAQRAVVTMRDVEGLEAAEVCELLGITEANQRVLLHRGRSRVRAALERHLAGGERP